MTVCFAMDPDMSRPSWALARLVNGEPKVLAVDCIKITCPEGVRGKEKLPHTLRGLGEYFAHRKIAFEKLCDYIVIEGQKNVHGTARKDDILNLAVSAGMCAVFADSLMGHPYSQVLIPNPHTWKGDAHKHVHQARLCKKLGWKYTKRGSSDKTKYCVPSEHDIEHVGEDVNPGDWKHILDAVGLALYGLDHHLMLDRRTRRAERAAGG